MPLAESSTCLLIPSNAQSSYSRISTKIEKYTTEQSVSFTMSLQVIDPACSDDCPPCLYRGINQAGSVSVAGGDGLPYLSGDTGSGNDPGWSAAQSGPCWHGLRPR